MLNTKILPISEKESKHSECPVLPVLHMGSFQDKHSAGILLSLYVLLSTS